MGALAIVAPERFLIQWMRFFTRRFLQRARGTARAGLSTEYAAM
jgi:hypothetical protein